MKTFLLTLAGLCLAFATQAQMGFNTPPGVKLTEDFEYYSRNGFLVQEKYTVTAADPNTLIRTMNCTTNPPAITALAGVLKDPSGDGNYTAGVSYSCTQTVVSPAVAGSFVVGIEIIFDDFNLGFPDDRVFLVDANGLERDLYQMRPTTRILVNGSSFTIRFVTNTDAGVGQGFQLRWRTLFRQFFPYQTTGTGAGLNAVSSSLYFNTSTGAFQAGEANSVRGDGKAIGERNDACCGAIAIGTQNKVNWIAMAIGSNNTATGVRAIALGSRNDASGTESVVIGTDNTAGGYRSTAMGYNVSTGRNRGTFIIGDSDPLTQGVTHSITPDQFVARFLNGYYLMTSGDLNPGAGYGSVQTGVRIGRGQSSWATISDSTKKERFQPINSADMLRKIGAMNLTTWNYKGQHNIRHYGPMAQDFYAAFGNDGTGQIGCDTLIYSHDLAGVTFSAVQALIRENEQLKIQNSQLKARLDHTERETSSQRNRLEALERRVFVRSRPLAGHILSKPVRNRLY